MAIRSPNFFSYPDAQNAIFPGSVRPLDLFVQGPFAFIFYVWTIYYGLSLELMSRIMHFLYIGSPICKILKIQKVHWSKLHLLIYPFLRSKQLHLSIIIIAIFKTVPLPLPQIISFIYSLINSILYFRFEFFIRKLDNS